jgi:hypothetical protein
MPHSTSWWRNGKCQRCNVPPATQDQEAQNHLEHVPDVSIGIQGPSDLILLSVIHIEFKRSGSNFGRRQTQVMRHPTYLPWW